MSSVQRTPYSIYTHTQESSPHLTSSNHNQAACCSPGGSTSNRSCMNFLSLSFSLCRSAFCLLAWDSFLFFTRCRWPWTSRLISFSGSRRVWNCSMQKFNTLSSAWPFSFKWAGIGIEGSLGSTSRSTTSGSRLEGSSTSASAPTSIAAAASLSASEDLRRLNEPRSWVNWVYSWTALWAMMRTVFRLGTVAFS